MEEDLRDIVQHLRGNTVLDPEALVEALYQIALRVEALQMRLDRIEDPGAPPICLK